MASIALLLSLHYRIFCRYYCQLDRMCLASCHRRTPNHLSSVFRPQNVNFLRFHFQIKWTREWTIVFWMRMPYLLCSPSIFKIFLTFSIHRCQLIVLCRVMHIVFYSLQRFCDKQTSVRIGRIHFTKIWNNAAKCCDYNGLITKPNWL